MGAALDLRQWIDRQPGPGWLADERRRAASVDAEARLPHWDRTESAGLDPTRYGAPAGQVTLRLPPEAEGRGIVFLPLSQAASAEPELVRRLLGRIVPADGKLEARNLAAADGCILYVPDRVAVSAPLEITYHMGDADGAQFHPRTVIGLGRTAEVNVVVHVDGGPGAGRGAAMATSIVEADIGDGAQLRYVEAQHWGDGVRAYARREAELGRDARVHWLIGEMGGALLRSGTATNLRGTGGEARSLLVFFGSGTQHMDLLATLHHFGARTDGLMLARGVLKGTARTIYRGTSDIERAAKGSNSQQKENVLHLSPGVRSDAIPALYIDESELQAGHAATTGKLDPEQLFYMGSRGLPEREAERLIVHGFFRPLIDRIPVESAQETLSALIDGKLDGPANGAGAAGR